MSYSLSTDWFICPQPANLAKNLTSKFFCSYLCKETKTSLTFSLSHLGNSIFILEIKGNLQRENRIGIL